MLFRGDDGLDELTTTGPSTVYDVRDGVATATTLDPADLGFARASVDDLRGGDAPASAELVRALLAGEQGPRRDVVLLNAGAALEVAGRAPSLAEGMALAAASIDAGEAAAALERWVGASRDRVASAPDDPVRPHDPRGDRRRPHRDRSVRRAMRPAVVGRPARRLAVPRLREQPLPVHRREGRAARPHRARRDQARRGRSSCTRGSSCSARRWSAWHCPTTSSRGSRASPRSAASAC